MPPPSTTVLCHHLISHLPFRRLKPPPSLRFTLIRYYSSVEPNSEIQINGEKVSNKPPICTADELHYVTVKNSDWRLALWRYHPSPLAKLRKRPLLLLSGVGTNAISYDLSPECSFARYMSEKGFDTWILEVRGAGLSIHESNFKEIEQSAHEISEQMEANAATGTKKARVGSKNLNKNETSQTESRFEIVNKDPGALPTLWKESILVTKLTEIFITLSDRVSSFLSVGQSRLISSKLFDQFSKLVVDSFLAKRFNKIKDKVVSLLEVKQISTVSNQIKDISQKLTNIIEEGQRTVSTPLFNAHNHITKTIEDFQNQLGLINKFDWDFDHYLEEDVPAAIQYIKAHTNTEDGKLVAVGHSMGGILLYSMLSRFGSEGRESGLAAIVTLASSLDYTSSKSTLKLLLPFAEPARALNVPIVPLGKILTAAYPFTSYPPYVLSWLNHTISAQDMMHPELLKKLVLNSFCTISAKLLLQLASAFRERGLSDRSGMFFYKEHIHKINVPVLAIAGDKDAICPPEAVQETTKLIPEELVTYKLFGEPDGPHYAHYDLIAGRLAVDEVYPYVAQFLDQYDEK